MKVNDVVSGAVLAVLALAVLVYTRSFPAVHGQVFGPGVFPGVVAVVLLACAAVLIARGWKARAAGPWFEVPDWIASPRHLAAFLLVIVATIAYIALGGVLGFFIVGTLMLFALFRALDVRAPVASVVAIAATLVIWYAFYKLLRVPLPWGLLQRFAI